MKPVSYLVIGLVLGGLAVSKRSTAFQSTTQDPVKLSPQYYTVRLENDRVRVLDYILKPGQKEVMHTHPRYIAYFLSDATLRAARAFSDCT
jgi:hypothetical protein